MCLVNVTIRNFKLKMCEICAKQVNIKILF